MLKLICFKVWLKTNDETVEFVFILTGYVMSSNSIRNVESLELKEERERAKKAKDGSE